MSLPAKQYNSYLKEKNLDKLSVYEKGLNLYNERNYKGAIIKLTEAIAINPESAKAYFYRANSYRLDCQFGLAINDYSKVIELKPSKPNIYVMRGEVYRKNNVVCRYRGAVAPYGVVAYGQCTAVSAGRKNEGY